jgi:hypothetical protein
VYRSLKKFRITDFTEHILSAFPNASLLGSTEIIQDKHRNHDGQYIIISKLSNEPKKDETKVYPFKQGAPVPKYVSSYYSQNELRCFSYQRIFRKGPKTDNEFVNLWAEISTVTCESSLPTILNRSRIIKTDVQQLSPVENAINSLNEKYDSLYDLFTEFDQVKAGAPVNVNPLTMSLLGVIDAAVMGGMDKYQECFFIPQYVADNPHETDNLVILQQSILLILEIVDVGLGIHGRLCPNDLRPLQHRMEEQLFSLKKKNGLLPPEAVFAPRYRLFFAHRQCFVENQILVLSY